MSELIIDKITTRDGSNVGAIVVADIDELLLLNTNKEINTTAIVKDSNRGGVFNYDGAQSGVNNGGTIFNGWVRQYDGAVNVKWFGAVGDGVVDDTALFATITSSFKDIYIPAGLYAARIDLDNNNRHIKGTKDTVIIGRPGTSFGGVFITADSCTVENLNIDGRVLPEYQVAGTTPQTHYGITISGEGTKLKDVQTKYFQYDGLTVTLPDNDKGHISIVDCSFLQTDRNTVTLGRVTDIVFDRCYFFQDNSSTKPGGYGGLYLFDSEQNDHNTEVVRDVRILNSTFECNTTKADSEAIIFHQSGIVGSLDKLYLTIKDCVFKKHPLGTNKPNLRFITNSNEINNVTLSDIVSDGAIMVKSTGTNTMGNCILSGLKAKDVDHLGYNTIYSPECSIIGCETSTETNITQLKLENLTPTEWVDISSDLDNDWVANDTNFPPEYRIIGNKVVLRGLVKNGTSDWIFNNYSLYGKRPLSTYARGHDGNKLMVTSAGGLELTGASGQAWASIACEYYLD